MPGTALGWEKGLNDVCHQGPHSPSDQKGVDQIVARRSGVREQEAGFREKLYTGAQAGPGVSEGFPGECLHTLRLAGQPGNVRVEPGG